MQEAVLTEHAQTVLCMLMCLSVFMYVIYKSFRNVSVKGTVTVIAPLSAVLCAGLFFCMTLPARFGAMNPAFVLYAAASAVLLAFMLGDAVKGRAGTSQTVIFAVYLFCLAFITLFMRDRETGRKILVDPLSPLRYFSKTGSFARINHFLMNVALFFPFGFLGTALSEDDEFKPVLFLASGLLASCVVESIQLAFGLGECDLSDVLGNALGSLIGSVAALPTGGLWRKLTDRK